MPPTSSRTPGRPRYSGRGEPDGDERVADSPAGQIWDNCARHGVTYYAYGEAADFTSTPNAPPVFTGDKGLAGHASADYGKFRLVRASTRYRAGGHLHAGPERGGEDRGFGRSSW